MSYFLFSLWREAILPAFLLSLLFLPATAFAVVGDVTLTGLPPNTTVSLTNEETKERVEQKSDERGFVVIPMTGKSWQAGRHSVACQIDGKPVTSRIFLRDGVNRVDLTTLTLSARPLDPANRQKINEALKESSATLKADPKNSQALLTQGSALNRLGQHGQALSSLAQAAKLGANHPALAFETGWSLMRLGMYREAIAQLEKYEKMKPGLGHTSDFIGRAYLYMGELDKADARFNEALKRDPKLPSTVRFHQAVLETVRKNPQAASKHISSLLKEAPNSPTAQIFRNATLQPTGAKPSAPTGTTGKDYKLSDPIRIQLPPTTAGDVAAGVAKGVVGGLLGGLFGGGGREPEGPNLAAKPNYPETMITSKDGKTKINLSGAMVDGKPNIVMGVQQSPGNGAPHLMLLQDKNCNVLQPAETSVTAIWEQWMAWKLTVNWTKTYYENGRVVGQEKGSWSTPWHEFKIQVKDPSDLPGIWKDFNSKPFEGIREVVSTFDAPPGGPFIPADWNLITHATTDAGNNQLVTAPFVTGLSTDKDNNLVFKPMPQTACESAPPSAPLVASPTAPAQLPPGVLLPPSPPLVTSTTALGLPPGVLLPPSGVPLVTGPTTFPWTVGPYGITIAPDPNAAEPALQVSVAKGFLDIPGDLLFPLTPHTKPADVADYVHVPRTMIESRTRTETRPDGTKVETRPDGTEIATYPDGLKIEIRPNGTEIVAHPDGRTVERRPDGTSVSTYPDGLTIEIRPDRTRIDTRPDGTVTTTRPGGTTIHRPDGTSVEMRLGGVTTETRPDGTTIESHLDGFTIETRPDGTTIATRPDGVRVEIRPDRTRIDTRPDGTRTAYYPDGSRVEVGKDGSITFHDAPAPPGPAEETLKRWVEEQLSQPPSPTAPKETQPPAQPASPAAPKGTQPPPQPAGPPAPPSVLDFLDEAIVPS